MKKLLFVAFASACVAMLSCSKENEQDLAGPGGTTPSCDTVNMKYAANVVPILTSQCYDCHGNGRAFGGIKVDDYASVRTLALNGALLGVITHASGFSPMPKNAAQLPACDINKIRSWINRGALNN